MNAATALGREHRNPERERRAQLSRRSVLASLARGLSLLALPAELRSTASAAPVEEMEQALARGFGNRRGAGAIIEIPGGKILAAHNLSVAARRLAMPGSTLKTFTLHTLLETRKLSLDETFLCPGKLEIGGHNLDCLHPPNLGPFSPADALTYSCNNYFAHMGLRLAPDELARALEKWGFASASHLVDKESVGTIAVARTPGELQMQALGEYGVHVTPLELLQAYRRLALARREPAAREQPLATVFVGLESGAEYGMASAAKTEGLPLAGKTGTALADEGRWTHGWFAGYAPAAAPEIALVIFLERGNGPVDAAGIAHGAFRAFHDSRPGR